MVATTAAGPANSTRALGIMMSGVGLATVAGIPLGAFAGQLLGWRGTFWALAILAALAAPVIAKFTPSEGDRGVPSVRAELRAIATGPMEVRTRPWLRPPPGGSRVSMERSDDSACVSAECSDRRCGLRMGTGAPMDSETQRGSRGDTRRPFPREERAASTAIEACQRRCFTNCEAVPVHFSRCASDQVFCPVGGIGVQDGPASGDIKGYRSISQYVLRQISAN